MRIDYGYRLYFVQQGKTLVILLGGGDKRTQSADIAKARQMAKDL
ncbi:addiction module killer protein [Bosea sp. F3-2]